MDLLAHNLLLTVQMLIIEPGPLDGTHAARLTKAAFEGSLHHRRWPIWGWSYWKEVSSETWV